MTPLLLLGLHSAQGAEKEFSYKYKGVHEFSGSLSDGAAAGSAQKSGKKFVLWCSWKSTPKLKWEVLDCLRNRKQTEISVGHLPRVCRWCGIGQEWEKGSSELGHIDRNLPIF